MSEVSLAQKEKEVRDWHKVAETAVILIILFQAILPAGGETQYVGGKTYTFSGPAAPAGEIYAYNWTVTAGTPQTSSDASFQWTSPQVTEPTKVIVNLMVRSDKSICPGKSELELLIIPGSQPKISLKKDCLFTPPVRVGDSITYTYNVTNSGNVPLTDISLTDMQDWGPDCHPARADNGDGILNPGESWQYECKYIVPDPSDYQQLHIMSDNSSKDAIIQRLMDMKVLLEMKMNGLKPKRQRFNTKVATLTIHHKLLNGSNYTLYNYTNEITGESLSRWLDSDGKTRRSDYYDPVTQAILTAEYNFDGSPKSDSILLIEPKDYLKIEYDVASNRYKNYTTGYTSYTIIDYNTGDTLILLVHISGKIVSKEYRKTPGYRPYEEKYFLKNTASATGKAPDGSIVSDMDSFSLEIYKQLPVLRITKKADPDPVSPGGTINYTITYQNIGKEDAHQIVVREKYDPNLKFKSANPIPDAGNFDTWTLGDLKSGDSGTIIINANINSNAEYGSSIMNVAEVTCKENSTDRATINTTVGGLYVTKTAPDIVKIGSTLNYTINYENYGPGKQTNVTIYDELDRNVGFEGSSPQPTINSDNRYWWKLGDLNAGDRGTISIQVKVADNAPDPISNKYNISSYQIPSYPLKTRNTKVVSSLWISKTANRTSYSPGDDVTYKITYGNKENMPAQYVNVTDILPNVELLSVSPSPTSRDGNTLTWNIGDLYPDQDQDPLVPPRTILIMVHVPEKAEIRFNEESSVRGEGYIYVNKKLSTVEENTALINRANISGCYKKGSDTVWENHTSTWTIVGAAGTELSTYEHGSGYYKEDERTSLRSKNHSIALSKDITAQHNNTAFSLPEGRSIKYQSQWYDRTTAENHVLNDVVSENYLYMDSIDKKSSFRVDQNQTVYHSESDFSGGIAQIDYKKHVPNSTNTLKEISENYHGSFRVLESVDSYGDSTKYIKSANGNGFVSSDKRNNRPISNKGSDLLQRSFEYGSGYYNSEESFQLSSLTKSTKMAYAPENLTAGTINVSYASLWNEGLITKDPSLGLILSEKIGSASYVNKDAWMETSSMAFMGEFNGSMDIRAVVHPLSIKRKEVDQSFVGNYTISTAITAYRNPKYTYPHVSISKVAKKEDESTMLFLINVTNDGNGVLKSLCVTDNMPDGLTFINSSLRPKINGQIINWTISSLDISRTLTIKLRAKIENDLYPYTNIARVTAQYNGHILTSSNSTSFTPYYLPFYIGSHPVENSYLAKVFDVSLVQGQWGVWKPSPSFNMTLEAPDCFKDIDDYYNDLDKSESGCCPLSSYDVP